MANAVVEALLRTALDYAGMFPPATLSLADAIRTYDRYRVGRHGWMLGPFVVSSKALGEMDAAVESVRAEGQAGAVGGQDTWPVSVVMTGGSTVPIEGVLRATARVHVAAVEFPPVPPDKIRSVAASIPEGVNVFFEASLDGDFEPRLDAIAASGRFAKLRTGGLVPEAFPSATTVYRFLRACTERGLACKATAGLHHALTGLYSLTYEAGSATAQMYGFLNVCIAAALVRAGTSEHDVLAVLQESAPASFQLTDDHLTWRGHRLSIDEVTSMRRELFRSFGSCSVHEPVDDLERLQMA